MSNDKIDMDKEKFIQQHIEMEKFFSGGFVPKGSPEAEGAIAENIEKPTKLKVTADEGKVKAELEQIVNEAKSCRKCEIALTRLNSVPGEGSPLARIFFIGEAPGADEDALGRPFVGRAGQLLDKIIKAMGFERADVFIGNILKCRPPENRSPKAEEIINCLPFLQRQIEVINPDIIIALGAYSAQALLETTKPIGQLRGQFFDYYPGLGRKPIKLMATFHPAYLLRNYSPDNRRKVWEDMKKVLVELGLPVPEQGKND